MSIYANEALPDLVALIGGAGAEPTPDTGVSVTSSKRGDPSDDLRHAIMFVQEYMQAEQDDEDLADASKILSALQSLLAKQQKLADRATGAGPGARLVRKAAAQQGA